MPNYDWQDIDEKDVAGLIEKINGLSAVGIFSVKGSSLEVTELEFYKNFKLLQAMTFESIPPITMQYLLGGQAPDWTVIKLNGTRDPIFENNPKAGLVLNEKTVVPYAQFVLGCVMSEDGTLRLVEAVDEDTFTRTPTPAERKEVTQLIRPAKVTKTDEGFDLDVIMLYGDSVYQAEITVKKDGFIEIKNEELLAEKMPIRPIFLE